MRLSLLLMVIFATGISCSPRPGDADYPAWVCGYENGMHVRHEQNDLAFDLQFQPAEYVWIQRNGNFNQNAFDAERADIDQLQYFTLSIQSRDGQMDLITQRSQGDIEIANRLLYYLSYRFQDDIMIEDGSQNVPCTLYHYEQHGTKSFVLGFKKGDVPMKDVVFTINSPLVDSIPVKIKISTDPKVL